MMISENWFDRYFRDTYGWHIVDNEWKYGIIDFAKDTTIDKVDPLSIKVDIRKLFSQHKDLYTNCGNGVWKCILTGCVCDPNEGVLEGHKMYKICRTCNVPLMFVPRVAETHEPLTHCKHCGANFTDDMYTEGRVICKYCGTVHLI